MVYPSCHSIPSFDYSLRQLRTHPSSRCPSQCEQPPMHAKDLDPLRLARGKEGYRRPRYQRSKAWNSDTSHREEARLQQWKQAPAHLDEKAEFVEFQSMS